ncbi:MAG TPA: 16S rRNA (adenine(1518)-N(6)/adenine(1519)-N(6))-dimethyltransferase RsmA [Gemmataceae bacterium]|nr:16S rRNA (adenine(1518)-N(6)/adenine(1519)-N(6))-dimethyltransferase RsmA [Gemmataceae bacterium]
MDNQAPRQTLSYLRQLFEERGIKPKNKLGQNFLIDLNLVDLIVRTAELTPPDVAVEIGSGTGGLTARMVDHAGAVLSVEIDPNFHTLVAEALRDRTNLVLLHADALKNKNHLNPEVLHALDELRRRADGAQLKLVSNLPYAVATPVISNFLLSGLPFERMVVTVQWEIAERLLAVPANKEYGALAVLVQSIADVSLVRKLPPSVFWPRPEVESAIVLIRPNAAKRAHVGDVQRFRVFLRDLYAHRRKNLRGGLVSFPGHRHSKENVDRKLAELGIDGTLRAETLDVEQHLRLCAAFGGESVGAATGE